MAFPLVVRLTSSRISNGRRAYSKWMIERVGYVGWNIKHDQTYRYQRLRERKQLRKICITYPSMCLICWASSSSSLLRGEKSLWPPSPGHTMHSSPSYVSSASPTPEEQQTTPIPSYEEHWKSRHWEKKGKAQRRPESARAIALTMFSHHGGPHAYRA